MTYLDCTYCSHRISNFGRPKRKGGKRPETERCELHNIPIPHPTEAGRYCEDFKEELDK